MDARIITLIVPIVMEVENLLKGSYWAATVVKDDTDRGNGKDI